MVERDLCIGFFIIRRMLELNRVSSRTRNFELRAYCFQALKDIIRPYCHPFSEGVYDLDSEELKILEPRYVSNQFIHSCMSIVVRDETRNWSDVYTVSDYDRTKHIWRIPITDIRKLFLLAANDYPSVVAFHLSPDNNDYTVETD